MNDHLITYLNDHLAGSVAGIALAKRCQANNSDAHWGEFLTRLITLLEKEQGNPKKMIDALGSSESTVKKLAGWSAEKLSRLKLNDWLLTSSSLSLLEELEMLVMGLKAQHRMWVVLASHCGNYRQICQVDFKKAADETGAMLEELEQHHLEAARLALCA